MTFIILEEKLSNFLPNSAQSTFGGKDIKFVKRMTVFLLKEK